MARTSLWWLLASFLASSSALSPSLVKHSLPNVPSGWVERRDLEALLRNISDPNHPSYGKHLSKEEVNTLSTPSHDSLDTVERWLTKHNASSVKWSSSQDSVSAVLSVSAAEEMLSTRFSVFEHAESGHRAVRTLSYSLPEELLPHIDFVHPTTAFLDPLRHGMRKFSSDGDAPAERRVQLEKRPVALSQSDSPSCVKVVDPPCLRKMFNIGNYTPDASLNNRIGVAGYLDIWARADSLTLYLNDYIPESIESNYTFDVVNITGYRPSAVREISTLRWVPIQVAYPIPMTYYTANSVPPYIPDQNQDGEAPGVNEPYLDFIDHILGLESPPTVITTSYGDDERTVPRDYANAVCQGFAKLGARGVTVLFSSGDQGLGVDFLPDCIANTGNNATTSLPVFPASVTTVGETLGTPIQTALEASGAGFSYYFDRPWYQDAAVSKYLSSPANRHETALQASMYNHCGRAYPEIVCTGSGAFFDFFFNRWDIGGGTSVAVPSTASMVALLNDWRLRHGKLTMGFLNPFLYGVGSKGLVDMIEGRVNGCEQPGFNATHGWDPATGLGFFDFKKLQTLVLL
ncbi:tripeptidyl peptidase A [Mycena latifolia]|nr:tripeptidyl peptidase A [Mycena latifolia]